MVVADAEFRQLWNELKTPIADELALELKSGQSSPPIALLLLPARAYSEPTAGLNAASSVPIPVVAAVKKKKGRKGPGSHNRRLKITNTHLKGQVDLSKDYTPGGR
jgi:transcription initiation factor TFIIE subunit beta